VRRRGPRSWVACAGLLAWCCAAAGCNALFGLDPPRLVPYDAADHADAPADASAVDHADAPADASAADHPGDVGSSDIVSTPAADAAQDAGVDARDARPVSDGGGGDTLVAGCKGIHGPDPVNIDNLFCIDSTEVTNSQYAEFLAAASPATITQPAACASWNNSFTPPSFPYPAGQDDLPVVAVNYCDAWSYCAWAGKRLCGRVGHTTATYNDVLNGEVYYACSGGATHPYTFTYGNTYDVNACDTDQFRVEPVKSIATCVSNVYDGLYDLSGNLAVWMDMCMEDPANTDRSMDVCRLSTPNGDASLPNGGDYACGLENYLQRYYPSFTTSMRCCSDVE
jgi:hypothetical protein